MLGPPQKAAARSAAIAGPQNIGMILDAAERR